MGYPSPVKGLRIALLQRQAALVNVLQDVVFGHGQEVVHSHYVIHCLSQDPYLKIVKCFAVTFKTIRHISVNYKIHKTNNKGFRF